MNDIQKIISFELTDKFVAWHDEDGSLIPTKLHAIALATREGIGETLVGMEFSEEDGFVIVQHDANFVCMLPEGVSPSAGMRRSCARQAAALAVLEGRQA